MSVEQVELPWMTEEYFLLLLTKYEGHGNLKLSNFEVSSGTKKGENYASAIYRVKINYLLNDSDEPKDISFILKTNSATSVISDMLEDMGVFEGETSLYENILVECEKLVPDCKFAPRLVHFDNNAIVLEDLNRLDFVLANRKQRFDVVKAKRVLEKVAKFHAATAVLHQKNPAVMERHKRSAFDGDEETPLTFFFGVSMQETLETLRNTPELAQFVPRLEAFDIVAREKNVFTRSSEDKFHVLNHGDLWISNIFFKFNDDNEVLESILVDYQESFWGSPGLDLNHFLYTTCNIDAHQNHFDELIEFYYDHLAETLKKLEYQNVPTLADIYEEIKRKADQALIVLCSMVAVMMIENTEYSNPENFIADGEGAAKIRRIVYGNPQFVELLKFMIPKLAEKNVF